MKTPPFFVRMKFAGHGWSTPRVWIPVGLLWIVVLPLALIGATLAGLVLTIVYPRDGARVWKLLREIYRFVAALRGTEVEISDPADGMQIWLKIA